MINNISNLLVLIISLSAITSLSYAANINVVDVRRNITLDNDEVPYKDYYLNAGEGTDLKKNLIVKVKRKVYVRDTATKAIGDFDTTVALMKIIHVGQKVSVGREYKLIPRDEEPMLEQVGIMSGDRIDTEGAYIDNKRVAPEVTKKAPASVSEALITPALTPEVTSPVNQ